MTRRSPELARNLKVVEFVRPIVSVVMRPLRQCNCNIKYVKSNGESRPVGTGRWSPGMCPSSRIMTSVRIIELAGLVMSLPRFELGLAGCCPLFILVEHESVFAGPRHSIPCTRTASCFRHPDMDAGGEAQPGQHGPLLCKLREKHSVLYVAMDVVFPARWHGCAKRLVLSQELGRRVFKWGRFP